MTADCRGSFQTLFCILVVIFSQCYAQTITEKQDPNTLLSTEFNNLITEQISSAKNKELFTQILSGDNEITNEAETTENLHENIQILDAKNKSDAGFMAIASMTENESVFDNVAVKFPKEFNTTGKNTVLEETFVVVHTNYTSVNQSREEELEHDQETLPEEEKGKNCNLPSKIDLNCETEFPKYYYDPRDRTCLYLQYGGCDSEISSFDTEKECFLRCSRKDVNQTNENEILERTGNSSVAEDVVLILNGSSSLYLDMFSEVESNVFDVLFDLRTHSPTARIISLIEQDSGSSSPKMINLLLKNGQFGVEIICHSKNENFYMDIGGIQEGAWHTYYMLVDQKTGEILLQLGSRKQKFHSTILANENNKNCSFFRTSENTKLWVGGDYPKHDSSEYFENEIEKSLTGCITNISIFHSSKYIYVTSPKILEEATTKNVLQMNDCEQRTCSRNLGCGMESSRRIADDSNSSILSLSGYDYIFYNIYKWKNRLQTFTNIISFSFKTTQKDSILIYATGENLNSTMEIQFLSIAISNSDQILLSINLGGESVFLNLGNQVADNQWHRVSVLHERDRVQLTVDNHSEAKRIETNSGEHFLFLDPLIFIGGVPNLDKDCLLPPTNGSFDDPNCKQTEYRYFYKESEGGCQNVTFTGCGGNRNNFIDVQSCLSRCHVYGLHSYNFFTGCIQDLVVNNVNILTTLRYEDSKMVQYQGPMGDIPLDKKCILEQSPSVTFRSKTNYIKLVRRPSEETNFSLSLNIKSNSTQGVLASGTVELLNASYGWELSFTEKNITFIILQEILYLQLQINEDEIWHEVNLKSMDNATSLSVNNNRSATWTLEDNLVFHSDILIGNSGFGNTRGFIGCLNRLTLDEEKIDLRTMVGSSYASPDLIMDGCKVLSQCMQDSGCHGGATRSLEDHDQILECQRIKTKDRSCEILKYRRSCEEYRRLGYRKSGTFIVDIDGFSKMPAATVFCDFKENGETFTLVPHNVPERFKNVKMAVQSFKMNISYRGFNDEMLRYLTDKSEACSQDIKFSCGDEYTPYKSASYSSPWQEHISYLGKDLFGFCHCKGYEACYSTRKVGELDGFTLSSKTSLPVTSITFLREANDSVPYSEPSLSLGKLICKSKLGKEESVQFASESSFLVFDLRKQGDLSFEFRTTTKLGNILHQPALTISSPSFSLLITSETSIDFVYNFKKENQSITFHTRQALNMGQWNVVFIDMFANYIRIIFNDQTRVMEIPFGPYSQLFDGVLIFGNVPDEYRQNENYELSGFEGCIRGLTIDGIETNLTRSIRNHDAFEVSTGCQAECDFSPCFNGATCIENWSSYKCECQNPFAHIGHNCETDLNDDSITFTSSSSEAAYFNSHFINEYSNALNSNFTFSFRTSESDALLFVAKDYVQNIIQIYLRQSTEIVTLFNFGKEMTELIVSTKFTSLSEGQLVQVAVERFPNATKLLVFTRERIFSTSMEKGIHLMHEDDYEQYPYEIFIGGARSYGMTSDLPSLVGCFSGLSIGGILLNFSDSNNWHFGKGIEVGCTPICKKVEKACKNGGYCVNNFSLDARERFSCKCKGTSYVGEICSEETAYTFNGREDGIALSNWTLNINRSEPFEISFAFASASDGKNNQLLLFAQFDTKNSSDVSTFIAWLDAENYLHIKLCLKDLQHDAKHYLNTREFTRHFVEVDLRENIFEVRIDTDTIETSSGSALQEDIESAFQNEQFALIIGGTQNSLSIFQDLQIHNFEGCISNLNIVSGDVDIWPLQDYKNGEKFVRFGLPKLGKCSAFSSHVVPAFYDFSKIPKWAHAEPEMIAVPMMSEENIGSASETFTSFTNDSFATSTIMPPPMTAKIWPWAIIGSVIILMFLLCLICILITVCKGPASRPDMDYEVGKHNRPNLKPMSQKIIQEEIPLLDKEPGVHRPKPQPELPPLYGLSPDTNIIHETKRVETNDVEPIKKTENNFTDRNSKEISDPITIPKSKSNRDSLPTSASKHLRHIDSSSSASSADLEDCHPSSLIADVGNGTLPKQNLNNSKDHRSQDLARDATEDGGYYSKEGNGHIDAPNDSGKREEYHSNVDAEGQTGKRSPSPLDEIDMKKYYLIRQASKPPKLPPKSK